MDELPYSPFLLDPYPLLDTHPSEAEFDVPDKRLILQKWKRALSLFFRISYNYLGGTNTSP